MIGIVLVTHGRLAIAFLSALEHIVGKQEQIGTVCIDVDDDVEAKKKEIHEKTQQNDSGSGVIVLTDMFGGTPSNLAISLMKKTHIEIVSGMNLPMLIRLIGLRSDTALEHLAKDVKEAGQKYINIASQLLKKNESDD